MGHVTAETTVVIILGAHQWPNSSLIGGHSYLNSALAMKSYFLDKEGMGISPENLLDLFDSDAAPADLIRRIVKWLEARSMVLKESNKELRDLFVYYVGHGMFHGDDRDYFLALRKTEEDIEDATSLPIKNLASCLRKKSRFQRRFLILDCCFAGAATPAFQSSETQVAVQKTIDAFPTRGTTILCASNHRNPAIAPADRPMTMFSGALNHVLRTGSVDAGPHLNMADVEQLTWKQIKVDFGEDGVRPELHCPDKSEGDLAKLPVFPNLGAATKPSVPPTSIYHFGEIKIQSARGGELFLDGSFIKRLDQWEEYIIPMLKAGDHQLRITSDDGYKEVREAFSLRPDETLTLRFEPERIHKEPDTSPVMVVPKKTGVPLWFKSLLMILVLAFSFWAYKEFYPVQQETIPEEFSGKPATEKPVIDTKTGSNGSKPLDVPEKTLEKKVAGQSEQKNKRDQSPKTTPENQNREFVKPAVKPSEEKPAEKKNDPEEGTLKKHQLIPGLEIDMVWIPKGSFVMGSPDDEVDRDRDEVQHQVELSKGFWMGSTEITQEVWSSVMKGTELEQPWVGKDYVKIGDRYPATYVSWNDIQKFLEEINQNNQGQPFKLPTVAQWEYACRADNPTTYSFGNQSKELSKYAWFSDNAWDINEKYAHLVGTKEANSWGLYDMHGNVWEWCADRYGPYEPKAQVDRPGPDAGGGRVLRGGGWNYDAQFCRSADRNRGLPDHRGYSVGFRLVRALPY